MSGKESVKGSFFYYIFWRTFGFFPSGLTEFILEAVVFVCSFV